MSVVTHSKLYKSHDLGKAFVLRLLLVTLLFNGFAPAFASQFAASTGVLLCTSQGYKWVVLDKPSTEPQQHEVRCLLCLGVGDDDSAAIVRHDSLSFPPFLRAEQPLPPVQSEFRHNPAFFPLSRAPPTPSNENSLYPVSL